MSRGVRHAAARLTPVTPDRRAAVVSRLAEWPRVAAVEMIEAYRKLISPLLPRSCRYVPSCSEYGAMAIERHGLRRGSLLALRRLLRCHPFASGGYDPVG